MCEDQTFVHVDKELTYTRARQRQKLRLTDRHNSMIIQHILRHDTMPDIKKHIALHATKTDPVEVDTKRVSLRE